MSVEKLVETYASKHRDLSEATSKIKEIINQYDLACSIILIDRERNAETIYYTDPTWSMLNSCVNSTDAIKKKFQTAGEAEKLINR